MDAWGQVRWLSADTLQGSPTGMWSTRRCLQVPGDGYHEPAAALVPDLNDPSAVRAWLD